MDTYTIEDRFMVVKDSCRVHPEQDIMVPKRSTANAAGYDFFSTEDVSIKPQEQALIMTDVKVRLEPNQVLLLFVRSSYGIKKHLMLANGTGVIDADYFENPDNDGNIGICLYNYRQKMQRPFDRDLVDHHNVYDLVDGRNTVDIKRGDRVAQGIILTYTADELVLTKRDGGFGSTGV